MANRTIKDAIDMTTNEAIYFRGHAKATYMSNGSTVEDAINNINVGSGGGADMSNYYTKAQIDNKGYIKSVDINESIDDVSNDYITSEQLHAYGYTKVTEVESMINNAITATLNTPI